MKNLWNGDWKSLVSSKYSGKLEIELNVNYFVSLNYTTDMNITFDPNDKIIKERAIVKNSKVGNTWKHTFESRMIKFFITDLKENRISGFYICCKFSDHGTFSLNK